MKNASVRIVEKEIAGTLYPLAFSLQAYAECHAKFGDVAGIFAAMEIGKDLNAVHNIMWLFSLLNTWGVKCEQMIFQEEGNSFPIEEAKVTMGIYECMDMKTAVMEAIAAGMEREVEVEADTKNAETTQTN